MKVNEIRPGFEKEVELLLQKKEVLEQEKAKAKEEALKKIDEEFSEREETIISILKLVTIEVEVEDPVEETESESSSIETEAESLPESQTLTASPVSPSSAIFN